MGILKSGVEGNGICPKEGIKPLRDKELTQKK
jgi:hypothetical protein